MRPRGKDAINSNPLDLIGGFCFCSADFALILDSPTSRAGEISSELRPPASCHCR